MGNLKVCLTCRGALLDEMLALTRGGGLDVELFAC